MALEQEFVLGGESGDLDNAKAGDYFAAVKTVRDYIVWRQRHLAKPN